MKKHLLFLSLLAQCGLILCAASSSTGSDGLGGLTEQLATTCKVSDINEQTGPKGLTKLMRAAGKGDNALARKLLLQKADPYIKNNEHGYTALMLAAGRGHTDIVLTLLALCSDKKKLISAKTHPENFTVVDFAKHSQNPEIVEILTHAQHETDFGPLCETYFSPNILDAVLNCIRNEQQSINCAMFRFTHAKPALEFAKRKQNGVDVDIIVDKDYKVDLCLALKYMLTHDITVLESTLGSDGAYNNGYFNQHHKYLIFGKNNNNKPLLMTGSCNFTHQAFTRNWENIIITDNQEAIDNFKAEHIKLANNSKAIIPATCISDKDTSTKGFYSRTDNCVGLLK